MSMSYIRKAYGVPAKRGMKVVAKAGPASGRTGYIRGSKDGRLTVTDVATGRYSWWGRFHPADLTYIGSDAAKPEVG